MKDNVKFAKELLGMAKALIADELKGQWKKVDIDRMNADKLDRILQEMSDSKSDTCTIDGKTYKVVEKNGKFSGGRCDLYELVG